MRVGPAQAIEATLRILLSNVAQCYSLVARCIRLCRLVCVQSAWCVNVWFALGVEQSRGFVVLCSTLTKLINHEPLCIELSGGSSHTDNNRYIDI